LESAAVVPGLNSDQKCSYIGLLDAVPKKRGPKTDVLEALLKRVDGLEAKLKEKNAEGEQAAPSAATQQPAAAEPSTKRQSDERDVAEPVAKRRATEDKTPNVTELPLYSPKTSSTAGLVAPLPLCLVNANLGHQGSRHPLYPDRRSS
jgi:hypothetical protein